MQNDKDELIKLSHHIKTLRKKSKQTLESLCYKNGLEPSTISRIENGVVEAKYLTLLKLSKAMNKDLKDLFNF